MLTRPHNLSENPLLDSPFNQQDDVGVSSPPSGLLWLTLEGPSFSTLEGPDWNFLGP